MPGETVTREWGTPCANVDGIDSIEPGPPSSWWGVGFFCTLAPKAPVGSDDVPTVVPAGIGIRDLGTVVAEASATIATSATMGTASLGTVTDGWSAITRFRTTDGWFATPVHATLLSDSRILFTGIARQVDPPVAGTVQRRVSWIMPIPGLGPMPAEMTIDEITEPVEFPAQPVGDTFLSDDLICSGQTLTADGAVVTAGGTRASHASGDPSLSVRGLTTETRFDGTTWTQYPGTMQTLGPTGTAAKWYPTVTRLPDKRLLVTGGYEIVGRGPQPVPSTVGLNWGTTDVMLPIRAQNGQWGYNNGSVFEASGNMGTNFEHRGEVFDPVTLSWKPTIDLGVMRHHPSSIVLPDGRILLVNGHDKGLDARVQQAEYVDPAQGFALSLGSATAGVVRGYHSVALLLPDGRVLVGGGRDQNTDTSLEKPTWQFYYPDYLGKPRPAIASAPA